MSKQTTNTSVPSDVLSKEQDAFLYIPSDIYGQIMGYVMGCDIEISGMGQLKPYKNGYIVTKAHLLKQECTGAETELDDDELSVLDYECEEGKYKNYGDMVWWWHSHVEMGTFWSATDHAAMKQLSEHGKVVATVFNKKLSMLTAYRQGASDDAFYPAMFSNDLQTVIVASESIKEEITAKVSKPAPVVHKLPQAGYGYTYADTYHNSMNRPHKGGWNHMHKCWNDDIAPKQPEMALQNPIEQNNKQYDEWIEKLSNECEISDILADDIYDEYCDMLGTEPENYNKLKAFTVANYEFITPVEEKK